jgi:prepilin-type N-terminal cleavage/methylation domain-containing protein
MVSFSTVKNVSIQCRTGVSVLRSASHAVGEPRSRGASKGFTLVELMIGLALVAILLGIGLPTFRSFILNQQVRAAATDLRIALTLTRSEAIKRNSRVELWPIDEDVGWDSGWTIPSPLRDDLDTQCLLDVPDGPYDPDDICLLVHRHNGNVTIATDPPDVASLQFSPMGRVASEMDFLVLNCPEEDSQIEDCEQLECMRLEVDGRINPDCPDE